MIRYFDDVLGPRFRVIATAIGTPDFRERLSLDQDPFWDGFAVVTLPDLALECRKGFLTSLERYFGVAIAPDAREILATRNDGTFASLVIAVRRNREKKQIRVADVADFSGIYPEDWYHVIYPKVVEPYRRRRNIFRTLGAMEAAKIAPLKQLVIELATRLSSDEVSSSELTLWWHRHRMEQALTDLRDWAPVVDGYVRCERAYYQGKAELSKCVPALLESIDWALRNIDYRLLRPSIHNLVTTLIDAGDTRGALVAIEKLLSVNPENAHMQLRKAVICGRNGDFASAELACREAIKWSRSWRVGSTMATILQLQSRFDESIEPLWTSLRLNKWNAATWVYLARAYEETNQDGRAVAALRRAERLDYANALVHNTLGVLYEKLGKTKRAIDELKYAAAVDQTSHVPLQTLAVLYNRLGRTQEAVATAEKAASLAPPENAEVWRILGRVYEDAGRMNDAMRASEKAMNLRPGDWSVALSYGVALGRTLSGQRLVDALLEISVRSAGALASAERDIFATQLMDGVAMVLRRQGGIAKAEMLTRAAIKLSASPAQYHVSLALALRKKGQLDNVEHELREAVQLRPDSWFAWSHLSRVLREEASVSEPRSAFVNLAEAVTAAKRAIDLNPQSARARLGLALILIAQSKIPDAEAELQRARSMARDRKERAQLLATLAVVLRKLGRGREAKAALTTATDCDSRAAQKYLAIAGGDSSISTTEILD